MKRVLSVLLCLLVLISSFSTILFSNASATAEGGFDNPDNWVVYGSNSGLGTTAAPANSYFIVTKNTNTANTYGGDASSLQLRTYAQYATVQFDVKPNTEYTLSYRMMYNGTNSTEKILSHSAITSVGGTADWGKDGCYDIYTTVGSARCDSGLWQTNGDAVSTTSVRGNIKQWKDGGVWHQVTHSFYSGSNEKMILAVRFTVANDNNLYLDDFNLAEDYDFESLANWGIYDSRDHANGFVGTPSIDGTGTTKGRGWGGIYLDSAITATGSGSSVKLNNNTITNAAMLPSLKANTKYNITFKYFIPLGSTWGSSSQSWFIPGVVKKGTTMNNGAPTEYFYKGAAPATTAGSWYDYTLSFTTDATTDYAFTVYSTFASGFNVYLDEFVIEEAPKSTYFIQDFENYTKSKNEYVGALSIVTPEGTSVSGTKALQYDGTAAGANTAEGNNRIILNPSNSGLPTLTELINKGDKFKVTFKYKLLDGEVKFYMNAVTDGANAWANVSTNPISYKSTTLSAGDTWQEFSYDFTLKAEADDAAAKYPIFLIGGTGKAYFDYVTVSTLDADLPEVEIPEETPEGGADTSYDKATDWELYCTAELTHLDGTADQVYKWMNIADNTNKTYTYNNGENSVKFYGNTFVAATALKNLEKGKTYTVSYKYFAPTTSTVGSSSLAWCSEQGIYLKGSELDTASKSPKNPLTKGEKILGEAGKWNSYSFDFTVGDSTELYYGITLTYAAGYTIYFDDFTVAEKEEIPEPSYDKATDWELYCTAELTHLDGTADQAYKWMNIADNTNKTYTYNNGENSVKFYGNTFVAATALKNLEKGKTYTVSYKYFAPTTSTVGSGSLAWCSEQGIYLKGSELDTASKSPKNPLTKGEKILGEAGKWNSYSFDFTVGDSTELYYGITLTYAAGYTIYFDDFTVTEKTVTPAPDPGPGEDPEPTAGDYDDAASWKLYHSDYAPTVNGSGLSEKGWIKTTQNTDKNYTYNNGEKSIKFYGNIQFAAVKLNDLEKDKAYKIKFKYFAPTTSTVGSSSNAWVNNVAVVKGGTAMNKNAPTETLKKGAVFAGAAGEWHEYSMLFRADSTDLYFGMCFTFGAGFTLYVDDFTVEETNEDPDAVPVVPGKEPKEEIIIDFETEQTGANANVYPASRIEIVEAEAYNGETSNMLHFIKGEYANPTTLNYDTTYKTDTDPIFTVGVKPNKVYNLSFRVKTNSQTLPENATKGEWIGIYASFNKTNIISSYQHNAKRDEWLYYNYPVTTSTSQNLLSLYVNAGEYTPDMWIDDIKLVETDYEPFQGWGNEPRDEILINFDDFYVNYDIACASVIDGPERDGVVSKATYLKGGTYNYNVVANYSAVTQYRDPVFTVPCKENTLYEFSYYIYVPRDTGSLTYFAAYYDWSNTWVLRASGMPERDEWVKKTIRFTTKPGQTKLSLTFNGGKMIPDIYLDDICLKELKPGIVGYANDESYSEDCFNIIAENDFVDDITKSKTTVIKIPVLAQNQYIFGITASSSKKSDSRIFLSLDGVNPMSKSEENAPSAVISADGKSARYGINFITDASGYVYLVIENDDGALKLDDPYLFLASSISTNLPMGFSKKQNANTLSVNASLGTLKELVVFGSEEDLNISDGEDGNPSTGSETVLPTVILFFTLLITCAMLLKFKKGGEQA